jgi:hypothetical protein
MFTIPASSLVHVMVPVAAKRNGVAVDPTSDTVQMAFLTSAPDTASPGASDWETASWETNTTTDPDQYWARCLVGTGGATTLSAGTYYVWVKVADNPETPVIYAGRIRVTP